MSKAKETKKNAPGHRHEGAFLKDVVDTSPDGLVVADRRGNLLYANPAFARLFGHGLDAIPTVEAWCRRTALDSQAAEQGLALWSQDLTSDNPPEREFPVISGTGAEHWCRFRMTFTKDGNVVLTIEDITHHMSAEERCRAFFDQAEEAILLRDAETEALLDFNRKAHEMLGYTREEFAALRLADIRANESPSEIKKHMERILKTGSDVFDIRHRKKNGDLLNVRVNCRVLRIGGRRILQQVIRDLTESTRTETALKESEEKFKNLADHSPNMIFINRGGHVVYANIRCEEIMGYSRQELCSPTFNFMKLVAPEYHALTSGYLQRHAQGKEVPSYEYVIVTKSGARIPAIVSTKLIRYEGRPAILGIVTDLSDLKYAEASLQEAAAKLRAQKKELEEKNTALKEVLAQIEGEKLEIKRQVTANVDKFILPLVQKMKRRTGVTERRNLDLLETSIRDLTSGFGIRIGGGPTSLSARETEICNMIKSGLSSKEISSMLQVSIRTVDTYRNRIRRKLGISKRNINLFSHIQTLV